MTRRERIESRLARRREWAEKAETRSAQKLGTANSIANMIPMGQPILVGHYSERRARRDADRIHSAMGAGVAEHKLARRHEQVATTLEQRLESCVFSDDPDAIEALEARVAEREREAERECAINKAWRKGGAERVRATVPDITEAEITSMTRTMSLCSWLKSPLNSSGTRAAIRRDRDRIEQIRRKKAAG